jgi:hypothetical protein
MSAYTTRAPLEANERAKACPMPPAAPVTKATLPVKSHFMVGYYLG